MAAAGNVSRETHLPSRQYRQKRGDTTRERLVEAVIAYAEAGSYRAPARWLAQHAGVHHSAISRHFGHVSLLYRVVAREHWQKAYAVLPFTLESPTVDAMREAVWAVLVGAPRELS